MGTAISLIFMLTAIFCWGIGFAAVLRGNFPIATLIGGAGFALFGIFMMLTGHFVGFLVLLLGAALIWVGYRWLHVLKEDKAKAEAAKKAATPSQEPKSRK